MGNKESTLPGLRLVAISLVNQTALLGDGAYRLEIISASLLKGLVIYGLVYLADTTCSVDLQIL